MDDHLRRLLAELGSALAESVTESRRVNRSLHRLRDAGYSLYLVVKEDSEAAIELAPTDHPVLDHDPVFKIDGSDLTFLRSIGIDPTRKLRRRRTS